MLLHYAKLAPIRDIANQYRSKKLRRVSHTLSQHETPAPPQADRLAMVMLKLTDRLDKVDELGSAISDRLTTVELNAEPPRYVENSDSGKWHATTMHCNGAPASSWRSYCGWAYYNTAHCTHHKLSPGLSSKAICGRCLPAEFAIARDAGVVR